MNNDKMLEIILDIQKDVKEIDKTLARNTDSLEVHIKRTTMLEKKMDHVEKHINMVQGGLKLLLSSSILLALYEFFSKKL
jgi:hypothetical protein